MQSENHQHSDPDPTSSPMGNPGSSQATYSNGQESVNKDSCGDEEGNPIYLDAKAADDLGTYVCQSLGEAMYPVLVTMADAAAPKVFNATLKDVTRDTALKVIKDALCIPQADPLPENPTSRGTYVAGDVEILWKEIRLRLRGIITEVVQEQNALCSNNGTNLTTITAGLHPGMVGPDGTYNHPMSSAPHMQDMSTWQASTLANRLGEYGYLGTPFGQGTFYTDLGTELWTGQVDKGNHR